MLLFTLCACSSKAEASRQIIDRRYTAPYSSVETEYIHKFDWLKCEFVLVPEVKTVYHDAAYEVLYRITYEDGSTKDVWVKVGIAEYENAGQSIPA